MAVKRYKPTSPARRLMTVPVYGEISKNKPERSLLEDQRKSGGRNNTGKITVRHIGGGIGGVGALGQDVDLDLGLRSRAPQISRDRLQTQ